VNERDCYLDVGRAPLNHKETMGLEISYIAVNYEELHRTMPSQFLRGRQLSRLFVR
jgi:hypothetical protein